MNLALETDEQERVRTGDLNVGFQAATRSWELIVKYHGDLAGAAAQISDTISVEYLIAGYGILRVPEELVDMVSKLEQVEYLEKPKRYYYSLETGIADTPCFAPVTLGPPYLTGRGVLMLIADSGIDWKRMDFRDSRGRTRIRYLWDQTLTPTEEMRTPEGFEIGVEFDSEQIDTPCPRRTHRNSLNFFQVLT